MHGYVLPHVPLLHFLFKGRVATIEDVYVPSATPKESTREKDDNEMSVEEDVYVPSGNGVDHMSMESDISSKRTSQNEDSKGKHKRTSTGPCIDKGFDQVCVVLEKKNKLVEHQMDLDASEKEKEAAYSVDTCYEKLEE